MLSFYILLLVLKSLFGVSVTYSEGSWVRSWFHHNHLDHLHHNHLSTKLAVVSLNYTNMYHLCQVIKA